MLQPVMPRLDWALIEPRTLTRQDEVEDLIALLMAHADESVGSRADVQHMAWLLACASLGDQHLWQDLGLPSRAALTALMRRWFPGLVALNVGDMRWKKFFYRQLCLKAEILICKSPSCADCTDLELCFPRN
jgi:nitrogen fixation protein NifQ